jgi:RNA polymerase sigma factor (sigma-70 family)
MRAGGPQTGWAAEVASGTSAGDLVRAAQGGDARAFEQIYRQHVGRVYALCLRMVADPQHAEVLTQDAFVRAWEKLGTYRGQGSFGGWLHRLTANLVIEDRRRAARTGGRAATVDRGRDQPGTGHRDPAAGSPGGVRAPRRRGLSTRRDCQDDRCRQPDGQNTASPGTIAPAAGAAGHAEGGHTMNHQQAWDRLDDFVDASLPAREMGAVGEHVAGCEACRAEIEEIRAQRRAAEALPREIAPPRDLWPAIAAAIEERPRPAPTGRFERLRAWRWRWPAFAAMVGVTTIALIITLRPSPPETAPDPAAQMVQALEAECRAGEAELARYTDDPKCEESGSIIASILGEIRTVDTAISEVKAAWSSDPNSPQLVRLLASYYRAKAALQGRATQVASRVSC